MNRTEDCADHFDGEFLQPNRSLLYGQPAAIGISSEKWMVGALGARAPKRQNYRKAPADWLHLRASLNLLELPPRPTIKPPWVPPGQAEKPGTMRFRRSWGFSTG